RPFPRRQPRLFPRSTSRKPGHGLCLRGALRRRRASILYWEVSAMDASIETFLLARLERDAILLAPPHVSRKAEGRGAVLAEISRRFCDPAFDLTDAARRLGLSRRYIQRLLEETGKSFTEHVLECRLQRARAMLMDSRYQHMAI